MSKSIHEINPPTAYKSLAFSVKAMGDKGSGTFELYAAIFGNVDSYKDIVMPGAFTNLDALKADGWVAVNHSNWGSDLGVAWIDDAVQDSIGLKISGTFHSTEDAQRIRRKIAERMAAGKSVKCSFGYRILDAAMEVRDGEHIQLLKKLEVFEVSFVTTPANPLAGVTDVKGAMPTLSGIRHTIEHLKAGRAISRKNMARLKAICDTLHASAKDFKAFMDDYSPTETPDPDEEPDDSEEQGEPVKSRMLTLKNQLTLLSLAPARHRNER